MQHPHQQPGRADSNGHHRPTSHPHEPAPQQRPSTQSHQPILYQPATQRSHPATHLHLHSRPHGTTQPLPAANFRSGGSSVEHLSSMRRADPNPARGPPASSAHPRHLTHSFAQGQGALKYMNSTRPLEEFLPITRRDTDDVLSSMPRPPSMVAQGEPLIGGAGWGYGQNSRSNLQYGGRTSVPYLGPRLQHVSSTGGWTTSTLSTNRTANDPPFASISAGGRQVQITPPAVTQTHRTKSAYEMLVSIGMTSSGLPDADAVVGDASHYAGSQARPHISTSYSAPSSRVVGGAEAHPSAAHHAKGVPAKQFLSPRSGKGHLSVPSSATMPIMLPDTAPLAPSMINRRTYAVGPPNEHLTSQSGLSHNSEGPLFWNAGGSSANIRMSPVRSRPQPDSPSEIIVLADDDDVPMEFSVKTPSSKTVQRSSQMGAGIGEFHNAAARPPSKVVAGSTPTAHLGSLRSNAKTSVAQGTQTATGAGKASSAQSRIPLASNGIDAYSPLGPALGAGSLDGDELKHAGPPEHFTCRKHGGISDHSAYLAYRPLTDFKVALDFANSFDAFASKVAAAAGASVLGAYPSPVTLFSDFFCLSETRSTAGGACGVGSRAVAFDTGLKKAKTIIFILSEDSIDIMIKKTEKAELSVELRDHYLADPLLIEIEEGLEAARNRFVSVIPILVPRALPEGGRSYFCPSYFDQAYYKACPRVGKALQSLFAHRGFTVMGTVDRIVYDVFRLMDSPNVKGLCEFPTAEMVPHLGGIIRSRHVRVPELEHMARSLKTSGFCILAGASGIGKSTLASTYAAAHASEYDAFVWIDCSSRDRALHSFALARNDIGFPISDIGPQPITNLTALKQAPTPLSDLIAAHEKVAEERQDRSVAESADMPGEAYCHDERDRHRHAVLAWMTHPRAPKYLLIIDGANDSDMVSTLFTNTNTFRGHVVITSRMDSETDLEVLRRRLNLHYATFDGGVAVPYVVWLDQWSIEESSYILREATKTISSCFKMEEFTETATRSNSGDLNGRPRKRMKSGYGGAAARDVPRVLLPAEESAISTLSGIIGRCPFSAGFAASYAKSEGLTMSALLARLQAMESSLGLDLLRQHEDFEGNLESMRDSPPVFSPTWPTQANKITMSLILSLNLASLRKRTESRKLFDDCMTILLTLAYCSAAYHIKLSDLILAVPLALTPSGESQDTSQLLSRCHLALRELTPSGLLKLYCMPKGQDQNLKLSMPPVVQKLLQEYVSTSPVQSIEDLYSPLSTVHRIARNLVVSYGLANGGLNRSSKKFHPLRCFALSLKHPMKALSLHNVVEADSAATAHFLDGALSVARTLLGMDKHSAETLRTIGALRTCAEQDASGMNFDGASGPCSVWDVLEADLLRIACLRWACNFLREARAVFTILLELQQGLLLITPDISGDQQPVGAKAAETIDPMEEDGINQDPRPLESVKSRRRRELDMYITMDAIAFLSHQFEDLTTSQKFREDALDGFLKYYGSRDHIFVARQLDGLARIFRRRVFFSAGGIQGRFHIASAYVPEQLNIYPLLDTDSSTKQSSPSTVAGGVSALEALMMTACRYADAALTTAIRVHGTYEHLDVIYALALAACIKGEAARTLSTSGKSCGPLSEDFSPLSLAALNHLERLLIVITQLSQRIDHCKGRGPQSLFTGLPIKTDFSDSHKDSIPDVVKSWTARSRFFAQYEWKGSESSEGFNEARVEFEEDAQAPIIAEMAREYLISELNIDLDPDEEDLLSMNFDGAFSLLETKRKLKRLSARASRAMHEVRAGGEQHQLRLMALCWVKISMNSMKNIVHKIPRLPPVDWNNGPVLEEDIMAAGERRRREFEQLDFLQQHALALYRNDKLNALSSSAQLSKNSGHFSLDGITLLEMWRSESKDVRDRYVGRATELRRGGFEIGSNKPISAGTTSQRNQGLVSAVEDDGKNDKGKKPNPTTRKVPKVTTKPNAKVVEKPISGLKDSESGTSLVPMKRSFDADNSDRPISDRKMNRAPRDAFSLYFLDKQSFIFKGTALNEVSIPPGTDTDGLVQEMWLTEQDEVKAYYVAKSEDEIRSHEMATGVRMAPVSRLDANLTVSPNPGKRGAEEQALIEYLRRKTDILLTALNPAFVSSSKKKALSKKRRSISVPSPAENPESAVPPIPFQSTAAIGQPSGSGEARPPGNEVKSLEPTTSKTVEPDSPALLRVRSPIVGDPLKDKSLEKSASTSRPTPESSKEAGS
ncbi:hypothetical protein DFJ73DRAFT_857218, partial [Zopfochytrium polystomum]